MRCAHGVFLELYGSNNSSLARMAISDNPAPSWYKEARAAGHVNLNTSWSYLLALGTRNTVRCGVLQVHSPLRLVLSQETTRRHSRSGFLGLE